MRYIYVFIVLLAGVSGTFAQEKQYAIKDFYLYKNELGINSNLYINTKGELNTSDLVLVAGNRVPIVSVHDGEPGLLDNLGSIVGTKQESCAVRKHSKCGRPDEIYHFHGIDSEAVVEAAGKALSETALEKVMVSKQTLGQLGMTDQPETQWQDLWPKTSQTQRH